MPEDFLCRDLLELGVNTQKKEEFDIFLEQRESKETMKTAK